MTGKIEWYREVLELEPNSKLFFPLSRLLYEAGDMAEAIKILRQGLSRHPEYLEARLFLIELLHVSGKKELCDEEVGKLSQMFAGYAGFWQAWAACLSRGDKEEDTASILRYLAAQFISGPIALHDAISKGVQTILAERHEHRPAKTNTDLPLSDAVQDASPDAGSEAPETTGRQTEPEHANQAAGTGESEQECKDQSISGDEMTQDSACAQELSAGEQPGLDVSAVSSGDMPLGQPVPEEASGNDEAEITASAEDAQTEAGGADQNAQLADENAATPDASNVELLGGEYADMPEEDFKEPATNLFGAENGNEESFTLRTRSMADVLAEQGDINGALDIYRELAANAANSVEEAEIQERIASLEASLEAARPYEDLLAPSEPIAESGREKLIGMLQTLASRVEARVNN